MKPTTLGYLPIILATALSTTLFAHDTSHGKKTAGVTIRDKEGTQVIPQQQLSNLPQKHSQTQSNSSSTSASNQKKSFKSFTGKVTGNGVRLRTQPDVESGIVNELEKGELVVVTGEHFDFYSVSPPPETKAYVFRSFVLDGVVEGNRVNVRLTPDLSAPVIAHLNTGDIVDGKLSKENSKWLEIAPPPSTKFYVAREYIEYAGSPDLKATIDAKKAELVKLSDNAEFFMQSEFRKPFNEIDYDRIVSNFETIINEFSDFPESVDKAKGRLLELKELYLQKKITYLESKAQQMSSEVSGRESASRFGISPNPTTQVEEVTVAFDRMKVWEPREEAEYQAWSTNQPYSRSIVEFYQDQRMKSIKMTGILEMYQDSVKNRPGDYMLRDRDLPTAYLYSTHVNLQPLVGKYVTLIGVRRENNGFAFPAFFVLEVE
ncbi:MAG: hypothetical protein S4CHLAM102_02970 [Chlamydiia bacterium]|nr:hypothetical protein [Chlamydiia bacterium]